MHRQHRQHRPRSRATAVWLVCAGIVLSACAGGTATIADNATGPATGSRPVVADAVALPSPVQHLDIEGTEYAFKISPDPSAGLRPGWTSMTFHNTGKEAHQVMFARIKDGVDLAELGRVAGTDSSGAAAIEFVDMLGGVSYIGPAQTTHALVDLPPGIVLAMCYVPNAAGTAHALMGMSTMLTVTDDSAGTPPFSGSSTPASSPPGSAARPKLDDVRGTIELAADGYHIPSALPTGWYRVVNTDGGTAGRGLHELSIMRMSQRASPAEATELMRDLAKNATPKISLEALGGMGAISPGYEGFLYLDLGPGDYVAVDFMPDPKVTTPHLLDGYYKTFSL